MRFFYRSLRIILFLVILCLTVPVLAIAALQVPAGQVLVGNLVSSLASSPSLKIAVKGLYVGLDLDASLERLELSDHRGPWLEATGITLGWHPLALLAGTIDVTAVDVARIDMARLPDTEPAASNVPESDGSGSSGLPAWDARIGKVSVAEINLGNDVAGEPVSLSTDGSAALARDPVVATADLEVTRIDGVEAHLAVKARFDPAAETLTFDVGLSEPRGGLAARLLDVPDLPALDLTVKGAGPLTDWDARIDLVLGGHTTLTGSATLKQAGDIRTLQVDFDGDLAPLAPPVAQALVMGTTHLTGTAGFAADFSPRSADLKLTSQTVTLTTQGRFDGARIDATANMSVSAGADTLIALDIGERRITAGPLQIEARVSGPLDKASWSTQADLKSFGTREARVGSITLKADGTDADFTAGARTLPFALKVTAKAIDGQIPATRPLSGDLELEAKGRADIDRKTLDLATFSLATAGSELTLADTSLSMEHATVNAQLVASNLAPWSELAGRDLGGALSAAVRFDGDPLAPDGVLQADLKARDLKTGVAQADAILTGITGLNLAAEITGHDEISVSSLSLSNDAVSLTGTGSLKGEDISATAKLSASDLGRFDSRLGGSMAADLTASGTVDAPRLSLTAGSQQVLLSGTPLNKLDFKADATVSRQSPAATVSAHADLNGQPVSIDADLVSSNGGARLDRLVLQLAGNRVDGQLAVADLSRPMETLDGAFKIDAPDLASISPLVLTDISGTLGGTISAVSNTRIVRIDLTGSDITLPGVAVEKLTARGDLSAPYAPEHLSADVDITGLVATATPIQRVKLSARPDRNGTALIADIRLADGNEADGVAFTGHLEQDTDLALVLALETLTARYEGLTSKLSRPATIRHLNGETMLTPLELALGSGSLTVSGSVGQAMDLAAKLNGVPLNLANAFVSGLGIGGTLSGTARALGSTDAPEATWELTGSNLSANQLRSNGIGALALTSSGTMEGRAIRQKTAITDANGLRVTATGTVGIDRPNTLDLTIDGTVPVAVFRRTMIEAGLRGEGGVSLSGSVAGTASAPRYQITARPAGLKVTGLSTGLTFQNIQGAVSVSQERATIDGLRADLATGGTATVGGSVGMTGGYPADIAVKLTNGRYVDPGLVSADVNADLKISGPLASTSQSALIQGDITIAKADISVPEQLAGAISPVAVRHINAPAAVRRQMEELGGQPTQGAREQRNSPPRLDIRLSAPGRIFVRGRGLDAELEGALQIVGTTETPRTIGAFSMRRGQLNVLTRRLVFSRGTATFQGSLTPILDFAANTTVNSTVITVTVSGPADNPEIAFTSSPDLPQDEVLALLLFGKSVGNLSASQIAQLAASITTLTGGSDTGPLATIRKSLGLDTIDINTDGDNGPSLAVGKYINDNIYLGVEQGTGSNSSKVTVDIDLDRGLKVRGEVGSDGSSKAGIFFEREY